MNRMVMFGAALAMIAGCSDVSEEGDRIARETAKGVVNGIVANRFPGVNAAPLTDCIIDNADIAEVYRIAEAAVVGADAETTRLILDIARRPETVQCATDEALNSFLLGT